MRPTLAPPPPTTTRPKVPSTTMPDLDHSPIGRYLLHPQRTLAAIARTLAYHAAGILHRYGLWLLLVAAVVLAVRLALARWRAARLHDGARLVEILPPPQVDPDGAAALWRNLAGLLRQRRPLQGRPHVAFEYRWSPDGLTIALWLPGMVAPRLVERAIEAAWPGARTRTTTPAPPPLPVGTHVRGGALRLAQPEWYPLRGQAEHPTDPLRALLGAAEELGCGAASTPPARGGCWTCSTPPPAAWGAGVPTPTTPPATPTCRPSAARPPAPASKWPSATASRPRWSITSADGCAPERTH